MTLCKLKKALKKPNILLAYLLGKESIARFFSDKAYLKLKFRLTMEKKLDLNNPQSFNEKLQWLKLYDRKPEYTTMVDKYAVREYIKEKIGEEYLVPLLGVWDSPEEIDFDSLPNQFVLKCNHNSGTGMCICTDKSKLDIKKVKAELKKGLKQDYFITSREWPYKNVKRKIIAEKYMIDESGAELKDYKIMCFNGEPKCIFVCSERHTGSLKITIFDNNWNKMPVQRHCPSSEKDIEKPKTLNKMLEVAELLSKDLTFSRIDFYDINGKLYFGEITFFPGGGFGKFYPEEWDYKFGEWVKVHERGI